MKKITSLPAQHNLHIEKTITRWDEAIPLGNGRMGALIWGKADALRLSLDRADIWDSKPHPGIFEEDFTYQHLIALVKEKKEEEIGKKFDSIYDNLTPSKLPAGKLILQLNTESNVESRLNLSEAKADIRAGGIHLECFLHAEKQLGLLKVNLPADRFSFHVENPEFGCISSNGIEETTNEEPDSLKNLHYPAPEKFRSDNSCSFIQTVTEDFAYGLFVLSKETADGTLLAFSAAASADGENWKEDVVKELQGALETGYEELFAEHCNWWKAYWEQSALCIPDKMMEYNWYLTNYLLASCSRKGGYPMQLQGLWTADDGKLPPWHGDYHHDLNTQLSYFGYLKANHLEEGESFLDFLWELVEKGERFAESFYHTGGMCLPSVMGIDGTPLGGWAMYSLSPANQIWLCQFFERHYRYTGDREFLTEKAYPYMKKVAECILGLLEEKDGKYYLPISTSPEIHDNTIQAFLTPNSNYDLALMRYLFTQLTDLAGELENGEKESWRGVLEKLPSLAINEQDILLLSPDEELKESHRHFSHLMSIHPLRLLDYRNEEDKRIIDANIRRQEILGTGYWVGYSFTLMAELYAIQGNGNGAGHYLRTFWDSFCSRNGFHLNGDYKNRGGSAFHYRPFTLEGNMCAADALQEMLLQSERGVITLFPAIPEEWMEETAAFQSFRAEGGVLVSAVLENGVVTSLDWEGGNTGQIRVRISEKLKRLAAEEDWQTEGDCYLINR